MDGEAATAEVGAASDGEGEDEGEAADTERGAEVEEDDVECASAAVGMKLAFGVVAGTVGAES